MMQLCSCCLYAAGGLSLLDFKKWNWFIQQTLLALMSVTRVKFPSVKSYSLNFLCLFFHELMRNYYYHLKLDLINQNICLCCHVAAMVITEIREQLLGFGSLLPPCMF